MPEAHVPDLAHLSVGVNSHRLAAPDIRVVGLRTNQLRFDNLGSDPQLQGTAFPRPAEDFLVASRLTSTRESELSAMDYFGDVMATTIAQTDDDPVAETDLIRLPRGAGAALTLEEALHRRRSIRRFSGDPLRLDQVATLLRLGDGVSAEAEIELLRGGSVLHHFRTAPSGGGLYPITLLIAALSVNGLEPGVYRYAPLRDALVRVAGRGVLNGVQDAFALAAGAIALDTALLPDCSPQVRSGADYHWDVLDLAEIADQAGLDYVKMTEHYLKAHGGYCPSPLAFLAAVAARTRDIRLLTGCILPTFHHPVQLASEALLVDAISNGRLDVGFARAYLPYEFETFQVPMDGSRERFTATVETVQRLWSEECVSVDTPHFAFRDATVLPRPTQDPHPPIWIAAVRSRQSFAWTGEHGYGLLVSPALTPLPEMADHIAVYRESYEAAGHPGAPRVLASLPLFVAPTDERAQALADPLLAEYLRVWADSTDSWTAMASTDYAGYTGMSRAIRALTPASFRALGSAVVGSPATVIERIQQIAFELDCDGFLWQCDFGAVDGKTARASLELFCSDVLPMVRGLSTARGSAPR